MLLYSQYCWFYLDALWHIWCGISSSLTVSYHVAPQGSGRAGFLTSKGQEEDLETLRRRRLPIAGALWWTYACSLVCRLLFEGGFMYDLPPWFFCVSAVLLVRCGRAMLPICTQHVSLPLQVCPVRGVRRVPDASLGAVWPVAVSKPGGLLHLSPHRENHLHRLHGHRLLYLHGP